MDDKIQKALQLKDEGFSDVLIGKILESPELENEIRQQMKSAAQDGTKNALETKIQKLKAEHESLMKKEHLSFTIDWPVLIRMKQQIAELQNELAAIS
jgi:hypothetical protein